MINQNIILIIIADTLSPTFANNSTNSNPDLRTPHSNVICNALYILIAMYFFIINSKEFYEFRTKGSLLYKNQRRVAIV